MPHFSEQTALSKASLVQSDDRFSPLHILLQLALACLFFFAGELDRIFKLWLLLVPIIVVPAIIIAIVWATGIISNLIKRRWRRFTSAAIAPLIVWFLMVLLGHNGIDSNWVRFQINKPGYDATIRTLNGSHPRQHSWDWGGTGGVAVANIFYSLEYDESDNVLQKEMKPTVVCCTSLHSVTVRSFGDHYYLVTDGYY